eukprot:TRINITY_DN3025_c0_g1_i2.p1 TRINITY_DN3025_c0_g1~~TRINITY_DN3025_c0_g1_i2.p1  ORF type:complete len:271 (-),score=46.12 TRINITY_DN3025_c0_g1_i2:260-1072(-)
MRVVPRSKIPSITTIDCRYMNRANCAAAYMISHQQEVAFVDNNTNGSVPLLLSALKNTGLSPKHVKYIIITHIHLDHAGGTSALAKACPYATILAHPRAAPHLVDPTRIIAGAKSVYGEAMFNEVYGNIEAIPSERVVQIADGAKLNLGSSELEFIHTRGHAKHHMVVHDMSSKSVITGDTFGVSYFPFFKELGGKQGVLFPSSSPVDFEPDEAHISIEKILATKAERAYPTHFGVWEDLPRGAKMLHDGIDFFTEIMNETKKNDWTKSK